jgi:hypothetical protein
MHTDALSDGTCQLRTDTRPVGDLDSIGQHGEDAGKQDLARHNSFYLSWYFAYAGGGGDPVKRCSHRAGLRA